VITLSFYEQVFAIAEKVLLKYPLCDACLGRLFAKLGVGLSNINRGYSIKTVLSMKLHAQYTRGEVSREYFEKIAENAGSVVASMYKKLFNTDLKSRECYLCHNMLSSQLYDSIAEKAIRELEKYNVTSFLIGVSLDKEVLNRELELLLECGLSYAESVKREIKREIGKIIRDKSGLKPDFTDPDAIVMVTFNRDLKEYNVEIEVKPLLLHGRYWKLARRISQVPWITRSEVKKYPLSIQEYIEKTLKDLFKASKILIHAAGREDIDARMIGSGRPLVIEIKSPLRRDLNIEFINKHINLVRDAPVKLHVEGTASRKCIRLLKESSKKSSKIYRVCIYSPFEDVDEDELKKLGEIFNNIIVHQKTPLRVLRRKKREHVRARRVYSVRAIRITPRVFEVLIHCEGGLYIKELVHGDQGRTTPSFATALNKVLIPVELDVLYVEEKTL